MTEQRSSTVTADLRTEILRETSSVAPAVENLACHQEQCDMDGVMVKVSRQALDEVLAAIEAINTLARIPAQKARTPMDLSPAELNTLATDAFREAAQRMPVSGDVRNALTNAALFLELGAKYAPDERISEKIKATGEMLKTRGLATVMRTVAASCTALVDSPEQDPVLAGLQNQSGINQSPSEGTPREGVSIPSTSRATPPESSHG